MKSEKSSVTEERPSSWANWHEFRRTKKVGSAHEFHLYSDSMIKGTDHEFGPYTIINTIAGGVQETAIAKPIIVLRARYALSPALNNNDLEHGGRQHDEIAALLSLLLGIRLKAGGVIRRFDFGSDGDPLGDPRAEAEVERAFLLPGAWSRIIPQALRTGKTSADLNDAKLLASFPNLSRPTACSLIRAARLYQEAIWLSERESWLTWLLLVSAAESAASAWYVSDDKSPEQLLRELAPGLAKVCEKYGEECVRDVAKTQAKLMGATRKFREFLMQFMPEAPPLRSPEYQQDWTPGALLASLDQIYTFRSGYLHAGSAIPALLCHPAMPSGDGYQERIQDVEAEDRTGYTEEIVDERFPMYLHVFEYIVRGALLKWWGAAVDETDQTTSRA